MGFKELQDLDCDTTTALGGINKQTRKKNPTQVEGYFIGSKQTPSTKSKTGFAFLHIFETSNGKLGVWGKTDLDRKLRTAIAGAMTRVTLLPEKVATKNGDMYKFRVEVDAENTIDVSSLAPAETASNESEGGYEDAEDGYEETDAGEEEAPVDEVPPARPVAARTKAAAAPDAARRAAVNALLGKRQSA